MPYIFLFIRLMFVYFKINNRNLLLAVLEAGEIQDQGTIAVACWRGPSSGLIACAFSLLSLHSGRAHLMEF